MVPGHGAGRRLSVRWRYALVGGVVALTLTLGEYWTGGAGEEMSFNGVLVGAFLAGSLAKRRSLEANSTAVGVRAGAIGGLAALVQLRGLFDASWALGGAPWVRVAGLGTLGVLFVAMAVLFCALFGGLAGKLSGWLVEKSGRAPARAAES